MTFRGAYQCILELFLLTETGLLFVPASRLYPNLSVSEYSFLIGMLNVYETDKLLAPYWDIYIISH